MESNANSAVGMYRDGVGYKFTDNDHKNFESSSRHERRSTMLIEQLYSHEMFCLTSLIKLETKL